MGQRSVQFAFLLVLGFQSAFAHESLTQKDPRHCSALLQGFEVLNQGFPFRESAQSLPDDLPAILPYSAHAAISVGGRYFSRGSGKKVAELRETSDQTLVRKFPVPSDYLLQAISENGEFVILTNMGNEVTPPLSRLKAIDTRSGREILDFTKPRGASYELRFGFQSPNHLYVQTLDTFIAYSLSATGAVRFEDPKIDRLSRYFTRTKFKDIVLASSGKLAVATESLPSGNTILTLIDMATLTPLRSLPVENRPAGKVALSDDDRYLAWANSNQLEIYDLTDLDKPVFSETLERGAGVSNRHLQWNGNRQILMADGKGRIIRRSLDF